MFFFASKIFWAVAAPSHVIVWCAVAAALLLRTGRGRSGTALAVVTALLLTGIGVVPSYHWLGRPLEYRYDDLPAPTHADGVLVLGGGSNGDVHRLPVALMLSRRYPEARIIYSSGSGALLDNRPNVDAERAKRFLLALGLAPARLTLEGRSRNTFENLQFSQALIKPRPDQTWILVSSAFHLPRAMAIAQRLGWKFTPWPSDHMSDRSHLVGWFEVAPNLENFDALVREYVGLLAYRWSGRAGG